jgi:hypothetical protein
MPDNPENQTTPKRGRGRPKGALGQLTIERNKVREMLDSGKLGPKKRAGKPREPKEILFEAANFFWDQAEALRDRAKELANENASDTTIKAVMKECERQVDMASKCAERAAPYYSPRVAPVSSVDGETITPYVAWLPMPAPTAEQWSATRKRPNDGNGTH